MSVRTESAATSHDLIMPERNPSPLPEPVEETTLPPPSYVSPLHQLVFSLLVAFGLIALITGSYDGLQVTPTTSLQKELPLFSSPDKKDTLLKPSEICYASDLFL